VESFDFLTGTVRVDADAPAEWEDAHELPFWEDPNEDAWGAGLCRVLYHEAVHFWHFLSSGYLANLVGGEWVRLTRFEETGELPPVHATVQDYAAERADRPFSPCELVEAWARYWDVHTRSPAAIIAEEDISDADPSSWIIPRPSGDGLEAYRGEAFDLVMQVGTDCAVYGRPYRWLLERFDGRSGRAALLFPMLVNAAFACPDPVRVFCEAVERTAPGAPGLFEHTVPSGQINLDWLVLWGEVVQTVLAPLVAELGWPVPTPGLDVIQRGPLRSHPIYAEYLLKVKPRGFVRMYRPTARSQMPNDELEARLLVDAVEAVELAPFAFPGQPFYRRMLGALVPPPKIEFRNLTWSAPRPVELVMEARMKGEAGVADDFGTRSKEVEQRVERFRAAEKAAELGLPLDAFA